MLIHSSEIPEDKQRIAIKYSPIIEIASSLRCMASPKSCPEHADLCASFQQKMDASTRAEFEYLSEMSLGWTLAIDLFCHLEQHNIESAKGLLATFPTIDDVDFLYGMLSGLVPKRTISRLVKQPKTLATWQGEGLEGFFDIGFVRKLIEEGPQLHKRMSTFLQWYWEASFEETWRRIGTSEIACTRIEKNVLAAMDEDAYLETCHPSLKIVNDYITVVDVPQFSWPLQDIEHIDVFLTAFNGPHLLVNHFGNTLSVFKRIAISDLETKEIGLEELEEFLRAISSSTKFQILQELYSSPKTTKELAEALDMAPSSISEHLKTLRAAELLYPQRVKNSVYNRFLYENYQAFASRLLTYFDN